MAELTVQNIVLGTSLTPSFASAAAGGDTADNSGNMFLYVRNGGGSPITVTVDSLVNCNQGSDHDDATTVPAGSEEMIGPFPTGRFNDSSGEIGITYSDVTSVTIAAINLQR